MGNEFNKYVLPWLLAINMVALNVPELTVLAADWPMRGLANARNPVSAELNAPTNWSISDLDSHSTGVKWEARVGTQSYSEPVIANGLVWLGTNNVVPKNLAQKGDASVLMCFREKDGAFLYQYLSPRLNRSSDDRWFDWPMTSLSSSPIAATGRVWFCTNRAEAVCLDTRPLERGTGDAEVLWKVDMLREFGVEPRGIEIASSAIHCSPSSYREFIYVNTTNGTWAERRKQSVAPSLICLRKSDGKIEWKASTPSGCIDGAQYGNPLSIEMSGEGQIIVGQGDGCVRSFHALTGEELWKFDLNAKAQVGAKTRSNYHVIASPTYHEGRVYVAVGNDIGRCDGPGRLICIDPTRRGDISDFVLSAESQLTANPNSGLIWDYIGDPRAGLPQMHCALASVAIDKGLLFISDCAGVVHCLNEKSGECLWVHETNGGGIPGTALIVDGKVYVSTVDGTVLIFRLGDKKELIAEKDCSGCFFGVGPVFANGTLYLMSANRLFAVAD